MKTVFLTALLFIAFGFSKGDPKPKIKTSDHIVSVDGVPYFKSTNNRTIGGVDIAKVDGTKLLFLRRESFFDPTLLSKSNTTGTHYFYSMIREGQTDVLCELSNGQVGNKSLARLFLEYNVIRENGDIDDENLKKMAGLIGMTHSVKRLN
jgi:hypothetical protein